VSKSKTISLPFRRLLLVDEFNDMGAHVSDLFSGTPAFIPQDIIEEKYTPFHYTSPEGKEHDLILLVHSSLL
jgi:hypothetical protein